MKKLILILTILSLCAVVYSARLNIKPNRIDIGVNETFKLGYSVRPAHNHYSHTWVTEDKNVAMIDGNGVVRGITPGYTRVYMELDNGTQAFCDVHVYENPNLFLNRYRINMNYHTNAELVATANYKTNFYFESSNKLICDVDNYGRIRANYPGHAIITVSTDSGDVVHCLIYVFDARRSVL